MVFVIQSFGDDLAGGVRDKLPTNGAVSGKAFSIWVCTRAAPATVEGNVGIAGHGP